MPTERQRLQAMDHRPPWRKRGDQHPERVLVHRNNGHCLAIVSDGTRVLGLGDIGPHAALPVIEGKAILFEYLGGVDAFPLCLATKNRLIVRFGEAGMNTLIITGE